MSKKCSYCGYISKNDNELYCPKCNTLFENKPVKEKMKFSNESPISSNHKTNKKLEGNNIDKYISVYNILFGFLYICVVVVGIIFIVINAKNGGHWWLGLLILILGPIVVWLISIQVKAHQENMLNVKKILNNTEMLLKEKDK